MADSNLGCKLANRYELLEPLGQGSMGRVYLAEDLLLGSVKVAIKLLSQTLPGEKMRERFMQEAMTCAQLGQKSIHVVRVTDYGVSDEGVPFYVMEYLQGQSLSHLLNLQPLPMPRFLGLIRQICLGLQTAHEGIILKTQPEPVPIIHRDIKPSNIMIVQDPALLISSMICPPNPPILGEPDNLKVPQNWGVGEPMQQPLLLQIHSSIQQRPRPYPRGAGEDLRLWHCQTHAGR